jgi:hypothetical protein
MGASVSLTLKSSAGTNTTVSGTVSRVDRLGFRKHDVGIEFIAMSQADRNKLIGIMRAELIRSTLAA